MGGYAQRCMSNSQILDGGTDELHPRLLQLACEIRILAKEAITGMHGLDAILDAEFHDGVDVQIRGDGGLVGIELERLIGLVPVLGEAILRTDDVMFRIRVDIDNGAMDDDE
jgi:hypothetical protein